MTQYLKSPNYTVLRRSSLGFVQSNRSRQEQRSPGPLLFNRPLRLPRLQVKHRLASFASGEATITKAFGYPQLSRARGLQKVWRIYIHPGLSRNLKTSSQPPFHRPTFLPTYLVISASSQPVFITSSGTAYGSRPLSFVQLFPSSLGIDAAHGNQIAKRLTTNTQHSSQSCVQDVPRMTFHTSALHAINSVII